MLKSAFKFSRWLQCADKFANYWPKVRFPCADSAEVTMLIQWLQLSTEVLGGGVSGQVKIILIECKEQLSQTRLHNITLPIWGSPLFLRPRKILNPLPRKRTNKYQQINSMRMLNKYVYIRCNQTNLIWGKNKNQGSII